MFIPEELCIIGTSIYLNKTEVTPKEVENYIKHKHFNIEYDYSVDLQHCKYNDKDNIWKVNIETIQQLNPYIVRILM